MPAKSEEQRKLMAIALGIKRGMIPKSYSKEATKLAETMTEKDLEDFAQKAKTCLEKFNKFVAEESWEIP